jgi:apolipoprotein N-acyltransferase
MTPADAAGFSLFQSRPNRSWALPWLIAALAGGLQACSLAWPWAGPSWLQALGFIRGEPIWWLQLLALSGLVWLVSQAASRREAAGLGWSFALVWLAGSFAWLYTSMHQFGGLAAPLAVLAVLALAAVLALYYAAAMAGFWSWRLAPVGTQALVMASVWLLAEVARGVLFTGFGWGAVAYAHVQGPLQAWIPYLGAYGVAAVAAALAVALVAVLLPGPQLRTRLLGLAVLGAGVLGGWWLPQPQTAAAGVLQVSLLQGNIAQGEKFDNSRGVPQSLDWYAQQLMNSTSTLVITPETALPVLPAQLPEGYWARLQARFAQGEQAALIGMPLGSLAQGYSNSVLGLKPHQDQPWRYDKHHLVPFGEFIPPLFRWFTNLMNIPLGDFQRGALPQAPFEWAGQRLAASICYETLFSEELAAHFAPGAQEPTVFFNVSNLAWFGEHLAMDQHLQIARMRALEFDRPFLLATNTGITAMVDHQGRVVQRAPMHQAVVLSGQVEGRTGLTPYARWMAWAGLWPLVLLALLVPAALAMRRSR